MGLEHKLSKVPAVRDHLMLTLGTDKTAPTTADRLNGLKSQGTQCDRPDATQSKAGEAYEVNLVYFGLVVISEGRPERGGKMHKALGSIAAKLE